METFARIFILLGIVFLLIGGALYLIGKLGLPLGRLPGDIRVEGRNFSLYFPLTTGLLLSCLLTIIGNLILRLWKR